MTAPPTGGRTRVECAASTARGWRIADGLGTRPSKLLGRAERILDES